MFRFRRHRLFPQIFKILSSNHTKRSVGAIFATLVEKGFLASSEEEQFRLLLLLVVVVVEMTPATTTTTATHSDI